MVLVGTADSLAEHTLYEYGVAPAKRAKRTLRLLSYITTARNILCMIENSLAVGNFRET
jgi:hypothetical protein